MKRNKVLLSGLIGLIITSIQAVASIKDSEPKPSLPNIVLIFADDMGYGDLNSFGATRYATPNLDKLAAKGMRFTNFYVSQAVCSASRAALLTGCYSTRVGIGGALFPKAPVGLNPKEETIAEVLKKSGYVSGIFGKWHLGDHRQFLPLQQGFAEYFGLPYSNDMWNYNYDGTLKPNPKQPPLPLIEGNETVKEITTMQDQAQLTTLYTEHAVSFIKKHHKEPFFLYVPHSMPHIPIAASSKFKGKSDQGLYGDVMMEIDWSVGQIMEALRKNGIAENTLIIFATDNGPWLNFGNHAGSAGGLREGKGTTWEGGMRVPCIMKWPGHIPEGTICNKIASTIDILPTLATIAKAPLPAHKIDGVNILSLMSGDQKANPREVFFYYNDLDHLHAVRKNQWKLVFKHQSRTYVGFAPGKDGTSGKVGGVQVVPALYDMRRDPGERYDVKDQNPEVVAELMKIADEARHDLGDKLMNIKGANVREPGKVNSK